MKSVTQLHLPFTGRKKKAEQRVHDLIPQREARIAVIKLLGGKCSRCGFSDIRALQIDHVNGGGNRELQKLKYNNTMYGVIYEKVKSGSKEYQVLCANCNWIKKYENREVGAYAKSKFND